MSNAYLTVEETAQLLRRSVRAVHELTRLSAIPHRRLPGHRRCLFRREEIDAWLDGVPLEETSLAGGGRIVRPLCRRAA
jgi:excisionase family DNA binding protein